MPKKMAGLKMAGKKANEPRVLMRVPISFHDKVFSEARERNMNASDMLEKAHVVVTGDD